MTNAPSTQRRRLGDRPGLVVPLVAIGVAPGTVALFVADLYVIGLIRTSPTVESVILWTPLGALTLLGVLLTMRKGRRALGWGILAGIVLAACIVVAILFVTIAQFAHEIGEP